LKIKVKPLPEEGKPDDFSGAVGHFSMEVQLSKKEVEANEKTVSGKIEKINKEIDLFSNQADKDDYGLQKQIEKRLGNTPCPLPHFTLHDGVLLDLRRYPKIASLKHSQLGLDFFEEAYLGACPYQFAKVSLDNLENVLDYLKAELE